MNETLPAGDEAAVAGRLRPPARLHHRPPPRHGPPQHGEDPRRPGRRGRRHRGPDPRPRSRTSSTAGSARRAATPSASSRARRRSASSCPSNSPGVHALWVPAIALKTALVLKPGTAEPWTPYRLIQAFLKAGAPPEAFGFYPTDHAGAGEVLRRCGRGIVFGDVASTRPWQGDPRVEVHGPGYSKVLLGPDAAEDWRRHLDVMVSSIAENGGRSCVNASGVWTTAHAREIAEALAERLAGIVPRAEDDPEAQLAPFANPAVARAISAMIDRDLEVPGAIDLTAKHRRGRPRRGVERRDVPAADGGPLRVGRAPAGQPRVPVPVRGRGARRAPSDVPEALGPTLATSVITERPGAPRPHRRLAAAQPPEPGPAARPGR